VEGLITFKNKTLGSYPEVTPYWDFIESFISKSGCNRIEIHDLKIGVAVSFFDCIIFTEKTFKQILPNFLFTVFHEFAHQYQFKKYGKDKMLELYTDKINSFEGAKIMKSIEVVADEFATRKIRELQKIGYLKSITPPQGIYTQMSLETFTQTVVHLKSQVKDLGLKTSEEISNEFYRWLKN
jgi:hypothetical protein